MTYRVQLLLSLLFSATRANLLHGGIASDLEGNWPGLGPVSIAINGNLNCNPVYYHSAGNIANDWVSIQMTSSATVNTILYLAAEHCCLSRNINLEFRVGTAAGPLTNPICNPGPIQRSGWYECTAP
jgi:hypothetical protein